MSDAKKLKALEEENAKLKKLSSEGRRFGYRRLHILPKREGWRLNWKKLYRIDRKEGLTGRNAAAARAEPAVVVGLRV